MPILFRQLTDPGASVTDQERLATLRVRYELARESLPSGDEMDAEERHDEFASIAVELMSADRAESARKAPPNPPNFACQHAHLTGFSFDNTTRFLDNSSSIVSNFIQGQLIPLLRYQYEDVFLWDCPIGDEVAPRRRTVMVSQVSTDVGKSAVWITFLSSLKIAATIEQDYQEVFEEGGYEWMYYFTPTLSQIDQSFGSLPRDRCSPTKILQYGDLLDYLPTVELLLRDQLYYVASQQLISSIKTNSFCVTCAKYPQHRSTHHNSEPPIWERAEFIPQLDSAMVQAARSIEALIGEPNAMKTAADKHKMKEKWTKVFDLDPEAEHQTSGMTNIEHYKHVYDNYRNPTAHARREISYKLKRGDCVNMQFFAYILLQDYLKKHALPLKEAITQLEFNEEVLELRDQIALSRLSTHC